MRIFGFLLMLILGYNVSALAQEWRTRTYRLRAPLDYWHPDTVLLDQDRARWAIPSTLPQRGLFDGTRLQRSGSLVRGITMAGNADPSTVSEFNLSLSGDLGNGIFLEAQISDQSMPIAPEGTTATLQDFDRIFIKLMHKQFSLQAGDVLAEPTAEGTFLKYRRNVLGMQLDVHHENYTGRQAFGVAKGKFIRKTLSAQAGIQGPYRLQQDEQYEQMQVISGSEKVYLNGELLRRGDDADYTLNYSLAQLQFTDRRPIAANDRIEVEYEYSERSYARYLFSSHNTWTWNKKEKPGAGIAVYLNVFSEHDGAASGLTGAISEQAQRKLEEAGDDPAALWIASYDSLAYSVNEVLYAYVDTLVHALTYRVFVRSTDPSKAHYRPRFSFMGSGKGNYVQLNAGSNGRSYVWKAPVAGVPQGDYDALVPLVAPMQKQMLEAGVQWSRDSMLRTEATLAWSYYDANTLSDKTLRKSGGWAGRWHLEGLQAYRNWRWKYGLGYWGQQASFESVDAFLAPEYALERSLPDGIQRTDFQSVQGSSELSGRDLKAQCSIEMYQFSGNTQGALIQWNTAWNPSGYSLGSLGKHSQGSEGNAFTQYSLWLIRKAQWAQYGLRGQYEKVLRTAQVDRSTQRVESFISSPKFGDREFEPLSWQLMWSHTDESFGTTESQRQDVQAAVNWMQHPAFQVDLRVNYRRQEAADSLSGAQNQWLMNGRVVSRLAEGLIRSQLAWGLTNGYEARTEYYFVFVGPTKGTHAWKDYNGDGVQQLAEFEVAQFSDEAEFVKVFAPSRQYVPVSMQNAAWALSLQPAAILSEKKGWKAVLACFSAQTNVMIDRKLQSNAGAGKWIDLRSYAMHDTALVSLNKQWNGQLNFQSPRLAWTGELGYRVQSQKYALSDGAEWGEKSSWNVQVAQRFLTQFKWKGGLIHAEKTTVSERYAQKNYRLREWNPYGGLEYHWTNVFRGELNYGYKHKRAHSTERVEAQVHRLEIRPAYYFPDEGVFQAGISFVYLVYPYAQGSVLAYEMLEGLRSGKNLQWEARFSRKVWGGMDAEVLYNGRRLSGGTVLHAGTVSLRMHF